MKKYVIVDIDGTISKVGSRLVYLKQNPVDWDAFYNDSFNDEPIKEIIQLVKDLSDRYLIIFCTGRSERIRDITTNWIDKYFGSGFCYVKILMRKNGDKRRDTEVKPELIKDIKKERIAYIIEDRDQMVKKWRELGYICLQPFCGEF